MYLTHSTQCSVRRQIDAGACVYSRRVFLPMPKDPNAENSEGGFNLLCGEVEADETFIGGKARNMHIGQRKRRINGTGTKDKTAVMGILERGGKVRTSVIPNRKKHAIQVEVRKHVEAGSALYSDALKSYGGLATDYAHQVIDHPVQYVDGKVHTTGWKISGRS
jgi:hypothetical protein